MDNSDESMLHRSRRRAPLLTQIAIEFGDDVVLSIRVCGRAKALDELLILTLCVAVGANRFLCCF